MPYAAHRQLVTIHTDGASVEGLLALPAEPTGIVLFAHGSGNSRHSPRNNLVAAMLRRAGLGTLLMDLLTEDEDYDTSRRFDIHMLARRLGMAVDWLADHRATSELPVGLFGASTGTAAALMLAATRPDDIGAIVSRGGRPELAHAAVLPSVQAPSLFIVGALDADVILHHHHVYQQLGAEKRMEVIPDASHLLEEPGSLEHVGSLAVRWFVQHLSPEPAR